MHLDELPEYDGDTGRFNCTPLHPYNPDTMQGTQAIHHMTTHMHDSYDWSANHDDHETLLCLNCGLIFEVTIPN